MMNLDNVTKVKEAGNHILLYEQVESPGGKKFDTIVHSIPLDAAIEQIFQDYDIHPEIEKYKELFQKHTPLRQVALRRYVDAKGTKTVTREMGDLFSLSVGEMTAVVYLNKEALLDRLSV